MNESRLALKVGLFALVTIVLLAALLLVFSKGAALFTPTYTLRLKAENVGGLKSRSAVLVAGVEVGNVVATQLNPDGRGVVIILKVQKKYRIHADARFVVEQIGLLGDQYVVVHPGPNLAPVLTDGAEVQCEPPFNLQAVARTTVGFIERVDEATQMLKDTIQRINQRVLTDRTLDHLAAGISNFQTISDRAVVLVDGLNHVVATNSPAVALSLTNFARFSEDLTRLTGEIRGAIAENRQDLSNTVVQLRETTAGFGRLTRDLESGHGPAGALLRDEELRQTLSRTLLNLEAASSNVANYGILYKPRKPKK